MKKKFNPIREYVICKNGEYDLNKCFKTPELAENHAKKNNIKNYTVQVVIQMSR